MRRKDQDKHIRNLQNQLTNTIAKVTQLQAELEFVSNAPSRRSHGALDGDLTPAKVKELVKQLKASGRKAADWPDCRNLVLQARSGGRADYMEGFILTWMFRWTKTVAKGVYETHQVTVGPYRDISIQEAREKALIYRRQLDDNKDPRIERANALCDAESAKDRFRTFSQVVLEYIDTKLLVNGPAKRRGLGYTQGYKDRIAQLVRDNVEDKVHPKLGRVGDLPIQRVDFHMLLDTPCDLRTLWTTKHPSASDLLAHLRKIFAFAKVHGYYVGDNPVEKELTAAALPASKLVHEKKQYKGVDYKDLPDLVARLRSFRYNREWHRVGPDGRPIPAYAVEVIARTGMRVSEVTKAQFKEIDYQTMTWHVPVDHLKTKDRNGKPRDTGRPIPINPKVYRILKDMEKIRENPTDQEALIFPSVSTKKGYSHSRIASQTLVRMLRRNLGIQLDTEENDKAEAELARQCAEINARTDLTRNEKICAKRVAGMSLGQLAAEHNLSKTSVCYIIRSLPKEIGIKPLMDEEELVNHAFRTTLLDWKRNLGTEFEEVLWRAQVDHELGDTKADNRYGSDLLLERRRAMMLKYENYIDNPPAKQGGGVNVVPFNKKRTA